MTKKFHRITFKKNTPMGLITKARKWCIKEYGWPPTKYNQRLYKRVYDIDSAIWFHRLARSREFYFESSEAALFFYMKFGGVGDKKHYIKVSR